MSFSVVLVNAVIFIVISILREDPLSTSMLDVFFRKIRSCVSFSKREFKYLKIDSIQPKLFVLVKSTDIYISSIKFVLNKPISMEVRFSTFPLSCVNKEFSTYLLHRCAVICYFQLWVTYQIFCDFLLNGGGSTTQYYLAHTLSWNP